MIEEQKVVTEQSATPDVTDRYEVETNIEPEPEKEPEPKVSEPEPAEEPKAINPRTAQRKAEKERLIRENAAMAERLRLLESKEPKEEKKQRDLSVEPKVEDYDDALEYTRDVAKYDRMQEAKSAEEQSRVATQQKQIEAITAREEAYRSEVPDYDERVTALAESNLLTPNITEAILQSDMGEKLGYHLAKYPSDLMTLRGLPKEMLPKAIKAIEDFINKPEDKPRVTQAKPPISPPGSTTKTDRSISSYTQEEIEDMPLSEWNKLNRN